MGLILQTHRLLSEFSTFGIGGPIRFFLEARCVEEVRSAYRFAQEQNIPVLVIGKGSNCLFPDDPFNGLVLLNRIDFCEMSEGSLHVGAGYSFSLLGVQTARSGFSGLEFASGIPATVGGAIFMNAGANGKETSNTLISVLYLRSSGELYEYSKNELVFSYRHSSFQSMQGCILSARFQLQPQKTARSEQLNIIQYRMQTQPLKDKSIGCIFRNPSPNISAGSLIDQCGLKGLQVGGAEISQKHANFIVNKTKATAKDVTRLIQLVQMEVREKTGYFLEPEIRVVS